jgi:hypothetical protein
VRALLPSRRPSPTTLAAANAEQAATSVPKEAAFQDGVLLILSYDSENIFVFSSLSYEVGLFASLPWTYAVQVCYLHLYFCFYF